MKAFAIFLPLILSGCSYSSRDTSLELAQSSKWSVENHIESSRFSSGCESGKVVVGMSPLLKSDGGVYFFLMIPIGSASTLDRSYQPINIYVQYPSESTDCSSSDVSAVVDGASFTPDTVTSVKGNSATCKYSFIPPIGTSGTWSYQFKPLRACAIPDLNLIYKTTNKFKYEKMQG